MMTPCKLSVYILFAFFQIFSRKMVICFYSRKKKGMDCFNKKEEQAQNLYQRPQLQHHHRRSIATELLHRYTR